ncbi:MAG: substrate-binding domain-containing protein [Acidobacteriota bacterium]
MTQPSSRRANVPLTLALAIVLGVAASAAPPVLRLATTTSTADTGLLAALLPDFERQCNCRVDVVAVGTGQALELGRRGDVDVLLVHAREQEDGFVAAGHAARRDDVMYNDFVIVGPAADPAGVARQKSAGAAFKAIAQAKAPFASRGDKSGTHTKELAIWGPNSAPDVTATWYLSVGQGMGETLTFANERGAYSLSDRATWLATKAKLGALRLLFGGDTLADNQDRNLRNDYGVMAVNDTAHPNEAKELASRFVAWLLAKPTQDRIGAFGVDRFGQRLYYPNSDEGKATRALAVSIGSKSRTFTLDQMRALPRSVIDRIEFVGVKRGRLGVHGWAGTSLKDILLSVDPALADARNASRTIALISSDDWTTTVKWAEVFGRVSDGERRYLAKGCNECHGSEGEGTAPVGKRPAPRLANRTFDPEATAALVRDKARHAGIYAYTTENLTNTDVAVILGWLKTPTSAAQEPRTSLKAPGGVFLLAYERDSRPMAGADGLIQFVVADDEFASRFAHWVASISVR